MRASTRFDAVVVGGGHNGLVAAAILARAGRSVLVLERTPRMGGAAVSGSPFPGVPVRLSRYAYLVSLFPSELILKLGLPATLRRRRVASYSNAGTSGLVVASDRAATRASMTALTGNPTVFDAWEDFHAMLAGVAKRVFPTLTEPLRSRAQLRRIVDDQSAWEALFEQPLSALLERRFGSELIRGLICTDSLIGTFAPADDPMLRQNRCFLYHVIGNGTGRWDVPVGGMGTLTDGLVQLAARAGAKLRTDTEVVSVATDGVTAELECGDGDRFQASELLVAAAPAMLARLLGERPSAPRPEGSQLKINMLLARLPRLRDPAVSPQDAFTGTFHVNESYEQLQQAYEEAARGVIPSLPPCELYCHSLTDPSILPTELRAAGAHTLTLFGLHMPARLFTASPDAKRDAVAATLRSVNSVLAEPLEECIWRAPDGAPCLEALTPPELETELAMPGGHIFHRDLSWPYAESASEIGRWGVETPHPNIWLCGAGARRGGGVSGIPGHNAAQAVLGRAGR